MASQWFYRSAASNVEERNGPFSSSKLLELAKASQLRPDDLIWKDGLKEWIPARKVPKLLAAMSAAASTPPPTGTISAAVPVTPPEPVSPPQQVASTTDTHLPAKVVFGGLVPTFPPFAAWSFLLCGVGWIWGMIVWFKLYGAINRFLGEKKLGIFPAFVPVWGQVQMYKASGYLNSIIETRQLPVNQMKANAFWVVFLPNVELHRLINQWNRIAQVA